MALDPATIIQQSECFACYGVSLTGGAILEIIANTPPLIRGRKYVVTSSSYAPVAGSGVTISAQLTDLAGNPINVAGRVITWSYTGTDGSFSSATSVTNASGLATVTFTLDFANFSHIVTATDARGLTGSTAAITAVVGPVTVTWAALVVTNGGVNPTALEQASADRYYRRCLAAGLTTLIFSEILMISSSLIGATTPFLFAGGGGAVWVNNSNRFVAGDLSINGLHSNGVDKYLTTVIVPSVSLSSTSAGLVTYCTVMATIGAGYGLGCSDNQNSNHFALIPFTTASGYAWRFINPGTDCITGAAAGTGYMSVQRTAANLLKLYWAKSTVPFSAVGTASNAQTGAATTTNAVFAYAANLSGGGISPSDYTFSYCAITNGMTAAQAQSHFNAVQGLRVDLGGGYV